MEETLRVFRTSCVPSHPFLPPRFIETTEQQMREGTLAGFDTTVVDDGGIRAFLCRAGSYVEALFVDPPHQRRGYGKRLLDHMKARTPVAHLCVFAKNPGAVRFYQREGFWALKLADHRETGETIVHLKWEAGK